MISCLPSTLQSSRYKRAIYQQLNKESYNIPAIYLQVQIQLSLSVEREKERKSIIKLSQGTFNPSAIKKKREKKGNDKRANESISGLGRQAVCVKSLVV